MTNSDAVVIQMIDTVSRNSWDSLGPFLIVLFTMRQYEIKRSRLVLEQDTALWALSVGVNRGLLLDEKRMSAILPDTT